jgi:hypothetical protein
MGRKKAPSKMPYLTPPSKPIFQTLPPELLHVISSELRIEDVLALRTTCSIFASVGLDYFEDEIPLVFHRTKFKALTEIAEHPKLSKQMRSLFYVVDRCKFQSFTQWDSGRPDPHPEEQEDYDKDAKFYTERDVRACAREGKKDFYKFLKRMAAVPESERRAAYENYRALCKDIADVEDEGYDLNCLQVLFEKCSRIREVTIASQFDIVRRLHANTTAFGDAMTRPYKDRHWWVSGVHQTLSVAKAVQHAGTKLESLTLAHVSPMLFDRHGDVGEDEWHALKELVQPLHRLRLFINVAPPDNEDNEEVDDCDLGIRQIQMDSEQNFADGYLHEIISSATELRVLKLGMPQWNEDNYDPVYSRLDWALGETVFPHLYELSISDCEVDEEYLVDLILRHKATLRRLYLCNISLFDFEASWVEVFTRISCQLPQLRRLRLRGKFYLDGDSEIEFEYAGMESRRIAPYRDALENFILEGGEYPTDDEDILPDQADYPDESYRRPGLPQDNTELDDPMVHYDSDEFDTRI